MLRADCRRRKRHLCGGGRGRLVAEDAFDGLDHLTFTAIADEDVRAQFVARNSSRLLDLD
jgi:hypothetical protein